MVLGLEKQTAVITGASSGIGRAIAKGLARQGVSLCLMGRNIAGLEKAGSKEDSTSAMRMYKVDLSFEAGIRQVAEDITKDVGHVDILIHCAGDYSMGLISSTPVEELDRQYKINVRAPYILTQTLLPIIRPQGGQIVFINSSAGLKARAQVSQYAASKHALKAIADSLREEVNDSGIRVLSVFPGRTATPMQELVHKLEVRSYHPDQFMQPEDIAEMVIHALSLPRTAEVTDIHIRPMAKT